MGECEIGATNVGDERAHTTRAAVRYRDELHEEDDGPKTRDGVRRMIAAGTGTGTALGVGLCELKRVDEDGNQDRSSRRVIGDVLRERFRHRCRFNERLILAWLDGTVWAFSIRLCVVGSLGIVTGSEARPSA